jgi:hypothetical protein
MLAAWGFVAAIRAIAGGIGGTKERDSGCTERGGEMQRSSIAGDDT